MSDDARLGYRHYEFWRTHGDDRSKYAAQQQARGLNCLGFPELATSTNDRVPHRDNDRCALCSTAELPVGKNQFNPNSAPSSANANVRRHSSLRHSLLTGVARLQVSHTASTSERIM